MPTYPTYYFIYAYKFFVFYDRRTYMDIANNITCDKVSDIKLFVN